MLEVAGVVRGSRLPFVRHVVGPEAYVGAWVRGDAVVLHGPRHTVVLGPPDDAGPLVASLHLLPERLTVEQGCAEAVRETWRWEVQGHWHWMSTDVVPPEPAVAVEEVEDPAAVDAVLDVANPGSHARPGTAGIEVWLGVRVDDELAGVGAIRRDPDGSGHLRGVAVLPALTGRGLGQALSAGLTRRAMDRAPHVATLGVYVDNAVALRIYDRLGYRTRHTFLSGPVLDGPFRGPAA